MKSFSDLTKNDGQFSLSQVAADFGISQTRSQFIPGRFYSLKVVSPTPDLTQQAVSAISGGKPYYDLNPTGLVFFHENWKETCLILNLRMLPSNVGAKVLEAYYAFSAQNGMANLFRQGELIPLNERRLLDQRFYMTPPSILSGIVGLANLNFAIDKYNIDQVAEARLIDWDNFGMLVRPRFETVGLFPEGVNVQQIFEQSITNVIR